MRKILHNLRKQPEDTRVYVLYVATIVAGVILFSLWVYSFGADLSKPETQANLKKDFQPFSALKANLVDGYKSITQ